MEIITIRDEFIKLGQAMKLAGLVESGVEAKIEIQEGFVKVNGEVELQRGKKIYPGDVIEFDGHIKNPQVAKTLEEIKEFTTYIRIFGSYQKNQFVL